jgi:hypothetical protein
VSLEVNSSFQKRLGLGNMKEEYVNDILNLCNIPSELNNEKNVMDIDLFLTKDNLYLDVKYLESYCKDAKFKCNIKEENCLIISNSHLKRYEHKREKTGIDTWVCFIVNYEKYDIYELRFIKTQDIINLWKNEKAVKRPIMSRGKRKMIYNLNRKDCLNMNDFMEYIFNKRD